MFSDRDPRKCALIVAGGPSAAVMRTLRVNKREIAVIAVNGALDWLPWFDYFFTLDPTRVNRKRLRTHRHNAKYFIAYPKNRVLLPSYVTRLERFSPTANKDAEIVDGKYTCAIGLNTTPNTINSGNSAFGALGLAYHLGFEKVGLIGVDADSSPRIDGGYSRDLSHLPALFESAMGQIDIINLGNMKSEVPIMSLQDFMVGIPHLSSKQIVAHGRDAALADLDSRLALYKNPHSALTLAQTINPTTSSLPLTPQEEHESIQQSPDSHFVLHQDVGVRKESPGTHVALPFLTTAL